jgi:hypothetical protein
MTQMIPRNENDLALAAFRDIKLYIDLYREGDRDRELSSDEWEAVKQTCAYVLAPYGMWDAENDTLDETKVYRVYMNLR